MGAARPSDERRAYPVVASRLTPRLSYPVLVPDAAGWSPVAPMTA